MFLQNLEDIVLTKEKDFSKGGVRPYDVVLMFKIIVLEQLYNLGDDQMEYQLNDRLSFRNFVGLSGADKVPDDKTIWLFNDKLSKANADIGLFGKFSKRLRERGFYINSRQMVDATFIEVPKQCNTREENKRIKDGESDKLWQDNPNKKCQKEGTRAGQKRRGKLLCPQKPHQG